MNFKSKIKSMICCVPVVLGLTGPVCAMNEFNESQILIDNEENQENKGKYDKYFGVEPKKGDYMVVSRKDLDYGTKWDKNCTKCGRLLAERNSSQHLTGAFYVPCNNTGRPINEILKHNKARICKRCINFENEMVRLGEASGNGQYVEFNRKDMPDSKEWDKNCTRCREPLSLEFDECYIPYEKKCSPNEAYESSRDHMCDVCVSKYYLQPHIIELMKNNAMPHLERHFIEPFLGDYCSNSFNSGRYVDFLKDDTDFIPVYKFLEDKNNIEKLPVEFYSHTNEGGEFDDEAGKFNMDLNIKDYERKINLDYVIGQVYDDLEGKPKKCLKSICDLISAIMPC